MAENYKYAERADQVDQRHDLADAGDPNRVNRVIASIQEKLTLAAEQVVSIDRQLFPQREGQPSEAMKSPECMLEALHEMDRRAEFVANALVFINQRL